MPAHSDLSRDRILRRRTPIRRRKDKDRQDTSSPPKSPKIKVKESNVEDIVYRLNTYSDKTWNRRPVDDYKVLLTIKLADLASSRDIHNDEFKQRLLEVYQCLISYMLKHNSYPNNVTVRPSDFDSDTYFMMLRYTLDDEYDKLYDIVLSISKDNKIDLERLNIISLVDNYIKTLDGYSHGYYSAKEDIVDVYELSKILKSKSYSRLINDVYNFYNVSNGDRIINFD